MKKVILTLCLLSMALVATAQDTIELSGSNYNIVWHDKQIGHMSPRHDASIANYIYCAVRLTTPQPVTIYGLAMPYNFYPTSKTILHPTIIKNVDGVFTSFSPDSLDYALHPRDHDCYLHIGLYNYANPLMVDPAHVDCSDTIYTDSIYGAYRFYYDTPIMADTFYVGFYTTGNPWHSGDSTPRIYYSCLNSDEYFWTADFNLNSDGFWELTGHSDGFVPLVVMPIVVPLLTPPDTDSFDCPPVEAFNLVGIDAGYPTFLITPQEGQDWYEVAYGPYDLPVDSLRTDTTSSTIYVLTDPSISPTVYYQARCRARCRHVCPVHDTVLYTPWTDPVYFYTGSTMPDTTHTTDTTQGIVLPDGGLAGSVRLMPNPASDQVLVLSDHRMLGIEVYQADGRQYATLEAEGYTTSLSVQNWPKGVYVLRVHTTAGTAMQKLSVE